MSLQKLLTRHDSQMESDVPEGTHDTPGAPESAPNRYLAEKLDETTGRLAHIAACLSATTLGELEAAVQAGTANGHFGAGDLDWARELWTGLRGCDVLAWALLRREFPAAQVVTPAVAGGEAA